MISAVVASPWRQRGGFLVREMFVGLVSVRMFPRSHSVM